jgi:ribokinase
MAERASIVVVGSVNLDIVALAERLPRPGETVTGATLERFPGGKGANQALAARRLGADVSLIACVGDDAEADAALALLREGGVSLSACATHATESTGIALISVSADGENQIVVAPGANRELSEAHIELAAADALICQLEVPVAALEYAAGTFEGLFCINLAPAMDVPESLIRRADLIVVNEMEAGYYGSKLEGIDAMVARTFGAAGAELVRHGEVIARSAAPVVDAVDTTGAGDSFTAALTVALVEKQDEEAALRFACAAGAAAAMKAGAQPSLPSRTAVEELLS